MPTYDYVIVGSGINGAIAAAQLHADLPDAAAWVRQVTGR